MLETYIIVYKNKKKVLVKNRILTYKLQKSADFHDFHIFIECTRNYGSKTLYYPLL